MFADYLLDKEDICLPPNTLLSYGKPADFPQAYSVKRVFTEK